MYAQQAAMSSGTPMRATGCWRTISAIVSSRSEAFLRIGVSISPGAMALTVIPAEPSSKARPLVKPMIPALAAE